MDTKYKTTDTQSAYFLSLLNDKELQCFNLEQAYGLLPESAKGTVRRFISFMVDRGLLMRIKEGLFYVIPYDRDPKTFMPDWHLIASCLVGDAGYYIGYYSAMQIHSLITQPALKEQIVVNKQIKPSKIKIKDVPFQFIYHNPKHFFGNKKTWIDGFHKVECSDLEKTFIDGLFKPEYAGGIIEITKALHKSIDNLDFKKLQSYALKFGSLAVNKRLGYLLELLQIQHRAIDILRKIKTNSYFLLEPSHPKEGKMLSRWNIQENLDPQSIISPIFS